MAAVVAAEHCARCTAGRSCKTAASVPSLLSVLQHASTRSTKYVQIMLMDPAFLIVDQTLDAMDRETQALRCSPTLHRHL